MTRQRTLSQNAQTIAGGTMVVFGLLIPLGNLDAAAAQLTCPLGTSAAEALGLLKSLLLAAVSQALQACVFDPQRVVQSLVHMLVSLWLMLMVVIGAVLLRAAFTRKVAIPPAPSK